jgi:hypothetical protein
MPRPRLRDAMNLRVRYFIAPAVTRNGAMGTGGGSMAGIITDPNPHFQKIRCIFFSLSLGIFSSLCSRTSSPRRLSRKVRKPPITVPIVAEIAYTHHHSLLLAARIRVSCRAKAPRNYRPDQAGSAQPRRRTQLQTPNASNTWCGLSHKRCCNAAASPDQDHVLLSIWEKALEDAKADAARCV